MDDPCTDQCSRRFNSDEGERRNLPILEQRQCSTPIPRAVPDIQDFDNFFGGTVHNHVRRADEFAGSLHFSGPAKAGEVCQLFNAADNRIGDIPGGGWIVLPDVINSGFKLAARFGCPPNQPHE